MEASVNGPFGRRDLGSTIFTIGRAPDNQLIVNDARSSSHHAEIRPEGQGYVIIDKGSTNGTFVNEQRLDSNFPRFLHAGDMIRVGDTNFTYQAGGFPQEDKTMLAGSNQGGNSGYQPTVAASSPNTGYGSDAQPGYQQPSSNPYSPYDPAQQQGYSPPQQPYVAPQQQSYTPPPQPAYQGYTPTPPPQQPYAQPAAPVPGTFPNYAPPVPPDQMNRRRSSSGRTILLIAVAVIVILAGVIGAFLVVRNNQITADNNAHATSTADAHNHATATAQVNATTTAIANITATAVANPYPPHTGTLALVDPLTDNSKGHKWDEGSNPTNAKCGFSNGAYHVAENQPKTFAYCTGNATSFSNFAYQVQMSVTSGTCGGITFRADSTNFKFYFFIVCQDGSYGLAVYTGSSGNYLITPKTSSAVITGLNQSNTIAVVASGSSISLFVNNQALENTTDSTFSQGQIGLFVDNTGTSGTTDVAYSNVKVWTL